MNDNFYEAEFDSPIGKLLIVTDDENILGLKIGASSKYRIRENEVTKFAKSWLERYFSGGKPCAAELPLKPEGTPFQKSVWKKLTEIPYGQVTSYGKIAEQTAKERGIAKMSARAVGAAVGRNPIAIMIPCHRVIGADGHLTGFGGGIELKKMLLRSEGLSIDDMYVRIDKKDG